MGKTEGGTSNSRKPERLEGNHGLLKLVSIYLAVFNPLILISSAFQLVASIAGGPIRLDAVLLFLVYLLLAGFFVVAGLFLWSKYTAGLIMARIALMLLAALGLVRIGFFIGEIIQFGLVVLEIFAWVFCLLAVLGLIFPILVFIYLMTSRRVKNTFPRHT